MVVRRIYADSSQDVQRRLDQRQRNDTRPGSKLEDPQRTLAIRSRQEVFWEVQDPPSEQDRASPGLNADGVV